MSTSVARCLLTFFVIIGYRNITAVSESKFKSQACPSDFLRLQSKCYYFSNIAETWEKAYFSCIDRNSTLTLLLNKHQNELLKKFLNEGYVAHEERWLDGRYNWIQKRWEWATYGWDVHYKQFVSTAEPNNWDCMYMDPEFEYKWNFGPCVDKKHYVCQVKLQRNRKVNQNDMMSIENANLTKRKTVINRNNGTMIQNPLGNTNPGYRPPTIIDADHQLPPVKVPKKRKFTCPVNFHLVGKKCYFFSHDSEIWDTAFYNCLDLNSELAVFKNTKQDARLKQMLKKVKVSDDQRWIGGRYDWQSSNWKWAATGNVVRQGVYKAESLTWACLVWDPAIATRWISDNCTSRKRYICQTKARKLSEKYNHGTKSAAVPTEKPKKV